MTQETAELTQHDRPTSDLLTFMCMAFVTKPEAKVSNSTLYIGDLTQILA